MNKSFIQIYTGNGKGKTTAAIGLAVRAAGADKKVLFVQFLKTQDFSEHKALKLLENNIHVECFGTGSYVRNTPNDSHKESARKGFIYLSDIFNGSAFEVIIIDEIFAAISTGLLSEDEVLWLLNKKPENAEVVLTGRNAPQQLIEAADLVTEMVEVKHYYHSGVPARKGIEM